MRLGHRHEAAPLAGRSAKRVDLVHLGRTDRSANRMTGNGHPSTSFHAIYLQQTPQRLFQFVADYLVAGLMKGQPGIVIAMPEHIQGIYKRLSAGFDIAPLERDGLLASWDVEQTLNGLLRDGRVDEAELDRNMAPVIQEMSENRTRMLRIFGEGGGLLWRRKLLTGAAQLEAFTSSLVAHQPVFSICGYDSGGFDGDPQGKIQVCGLHSHVLKGQWEETSIPPLSRI
jgi:hypothetical protein